MKGEGLDIREEDRRKEISNQRHQPVLNRRIKRSISYAKEDTSK